MTEETAQPQMDYIPGFGLTDSAEEGAEATAGIPLKPGSAAAKLEAVEDQLRTIFDPEIPVNIYDLGLIYNIDCRDGGDVDILMTLTAPACPVAGSMPGQVARTVAMDDSVGEVKVTLTWTPPWTSDMMSEDAKLALDFF